jgi:flagellar P-ring protein precursor FlgI
VVSRRFLTILPILAATLVTVVPADPARAVKVADVTRLGGQRTNMLTGLGLVCGLKGTGDGGAFSAAINPLRTMLSKFSDPVSAKELSNASNVAVVAIMATVPANGARNGDHLSVQVLTMGAATSLQGGHLFITPMTGPTPGDGGRGQLMALAEGPIEITDPATPTSGTIDAGRGGAVMEVDMPARAIDNGRFTLIIDEPSASWTMASSIAQIINESESNNGEILATAYDQKNVIVTIPANERERPDAFIARIQRLPVKLMPTEARVQINEHTGTIIMTGDVEISAVVISHRGLSISTITPAPIPTVQNPQVTNTDVVPVGTAAPANGNLQDLVAAMEQLKVPAEDRIAIIKELYATGKLHAKLIIEK